MTQGRAALVTRIGLMAALAALFQLSAGFLPGPGHVLSALGTLPIGLAAGWTPAGGLLGLIAASLVVFLLQPLEAPILLFLTGLLGWVLGWGVHCSWPWWRQTVVGGLALAAGMLVVSYGLGMPALGEWVAGLGLALVVPAFLGFALIYAGAWAWLLPRALKRRAPS